MKKSIRKIIALFLGSAILVSTLGGCANSGPAASVNSSANAQTISSKAEIKDFPKAKIGVLVSDNTGAEALAFRKYYMDYISKNFNTTFVYSDKLDNAEAEKTALENMISQGCKGIISFSASDRPNQIKICESAKVYYGVAAGALNDKDYNTFKSYKYFVGCIGPSMKTEYQVGYDMAKHYIDQGNTNFLIYGGAYSMMNDMHINRVAGMIKAFCDADSGTKFTGSLNGGKFDLSKFTSTKFKLDYMDGFPNAPASFFTTLADKVGKKPQVILAVGLGVDFFAAQTAGKQIKLTSVDSFTETYKKAFESGQLDSLTGKFAASIGPIFIAVYDAINGNVLRTSDGSAFSIDQGYWVANNKSDFDTYYSIANDFTNPVYNKDVLAKYVGTDSSKVAYSDFEKFVKAYTYDEIKKLK